MQETFSRTEMLLGAAGMERLRNARVAVFGIGGVGGYAAEALARSGVGAFDLIDKDVVSRSNLNRQIIALEKDIGRSKTEVMKERIAQINPEAKVRVRNCFFLPESAGDFDFTEYDYVVDAVDTVTAKILLVLRAQEAGVPVISCMGTGNKLHPELLETGDIYGTQVCPLARVMRRELKKSGVLQRNPQKTPLGRKKRREDCAGKHLLCPGGSRAAAGFPGGAGSDTGERRKESVGGSI